MPKYSPATLRILREQNPERAAQLAREALPIGGWLILLAIGTVLSPFWIGYQLDGIYTVIFRSGLWEVLGNPQHPFYGSGLKPLLMFEMTLNVAMMLATAWLAILFFLRRASFVKWFMFVSIAMLVTVVVDLTWVYAIMPQNFPAFGAAFMMFLPHLVRVFVWVPYLKKSDRARATFVR